ncbi:MAG: manganese efflux pump [Polyangiaceae bacterium]|nr:manganese efflux pump [Polyangiaceae bacterium]
MSFPSILFLALGLGMDATAVAALRGMEVPRVLPRQVLTVALFFGGFQALMPLIGWVVGSQVGAWVEAWDHWVAFVLLGGIGGKMLWEAAHSDPETKPEPGDPFGLKLMTLLAIATSVDALAAGITLPMLGAPLALSVITIGVTTAVLSALGLYAGRRFGALLGKRLDIAGGLALIALGTKILVEHLTA